MKQTVLITGSSTGIGRASAMHFQRAGWQVIATMRRPDQESDLQHLPDVLVSRLDVQDPTSITTAVAEGVARFGGIDAVINNAGYGAYGPLEATPLDTIRRQFDVNVLGLLAVTQAVLPHMRQAKHGVIVNISSIGGKMTFPLGTLYHGTKFAVEGLSESLHFELLPLGIRVKIIEPGMVKTDFAGRSFDFSNDPALTEYQPLVQTFVGALGAMGAQASSPESIAERIFAATVDPTDRLRYPAGPDAEQLLTARQATDDATFLEGLRAQFGLTP